MDVVVQGSFDLIALPATGRIKKIIPGTFSSVILEAASSAPIELAMLTVTIHGVMDTACADTAATHSIAGKTLNHLLRKQGANFAASTQIMSLADGSKIKREIRRTRVKIPLGGRTLPLNLFAIPEAKGNNTLLGIDFPKLAGIVLNLKRKT